MLHLADFDAILAPIINLYEAFADEVLLDIVRRLKKAGKITSTAAWQVQRLTEGGKTYEEILQRISELTKLSEKELREMFWQAGVRGIAYDNKILINAGLLPANMNLSPAMLRLLEVGVQKTAGTLHNLTLTTAVTGEQAFVEAMDLAYMQVANGTMSYGQAIKMAVKKLANRGLEVIHYPSGHKDKTDVAVRRAVLTGMSQTAGEISWQNIVDNDIDLIETSAHIGARNEGEVPENHEKWQGRVFTRKANPKYPDFATTTGYGTATGLCGINCRHSFYPFFEGSPRSYDEETLKEYREKTVAYNGKTMSFYEATQVQRKFERTIRAKKREAKAVEVLGQDNSVELLEVRNLQKKMRDFIRQTGLQRQYERESITPSVKNKV